MADVSGITAVRPGETTRIQIVKYGATIAAGNALYLDTADGEYKLADADASLALAKAACIAVTPGVDGGYGVAAFDGPITLVGATLTVGASYVASDTPGGIKPNADLATGDWVTELGRASAATVLELGINDTSIQVA